MLLEESNQIQELNLSRVKTEPFNCRCFKLTPNLSETYTLNGSVVRLVGELSYFHCLQDMFCCVLDAVQ